MARKARRVNVRVRGRAGLPVHTPEAANACRVGMSKWRTMGSLMGRPIAVG